MRRPAISIRILSPGYFKRLPGARRTRIGKVLTSCRSDADAMAQGAVPAGFQLRISRFRGYQAVELVHISVSENISPKLESTVLILNIGLQYRHTCSNSEL